MMDTALPWHADTAAQWLSHRERFAHAWLIHGMPGIGKRQFALAAAAALLCEQPVNGLACGHCLACGWISKGNHPDLRRIRPDAIAALEGSGDELSSEATDESSPPVSSDPSATGKKSLSKDIRIDQIRAVENWFIQATHRGGYRVAVIYPAESLNVVSANALLKVLEEPVPNTVFLLVTDAMDRLMPTLISRCRKLPLSTPSRAEAIPWLEQQGVDKADAWLSASGCAPVKALEMSREQPEACPPWLMAFARNLTDGYTAEWGALSETLAKMSAVIWLDALQRFIVDLNLLAHGSTARYYPSIQQTTQSIAMRADPRRLSDLSSWINDQRRIAQHPLTPKLFAHAALDRFAAYCAHSNSLQA